MNSQTSTEFRIHLTISDEGDVKTVIERVSLSDSIVKEIKKYIEDNNLKYGDKLPNQETLCRIFGVSKSPLREALRTLKAINVIKITNGKGIYVKDKNELLLDARIDSGNIRQSLINIIEVRSALEGLTVKLACEKASDDEIEEMGKIAHIMEEKIKMGVCSPLEDKSFHMAILKSTKNSILIDLTTQLYDIMDVLWDNSGGIGKALNEGLDYHMALLDSIRKRDYKGAERAINKILDQIKLIIKNI
jgi:GntR family transcriptional regulator, transcriptional repressor for pyruvate dehydrogenase complex